MKTLSKFYFKRYHYEIFRLHTEFTQDSRQMIILDLIFKLYFWESIYELQGRFLEMLIDMKCVRLFLNKVFTTEFSQRI